MARDQLIQRDGGQALELVLEGPPEPAVTHSLLSEDRDEGEAGTVALITSRAAYWSFNIRCCLSDEHQLKSASWVLSEAG